MGCFFTYVTTVNWYFVNDNEICFFSFSKDKNFEQTPILDSFTRNTLDPQLCDALKSSQEASKNVFNNYACQPNLQG